MVGTANVVDLHHGGDLGDTIYAIPALRRLANPAHLILYPNHGTTRTLMDENNAKMLLTLLNAQKGITAIWQPSHNKDGLRLDFAVRRFYRSGMNLADMHSHWVGHDHWPREHPWLTVDGASLHNYKIVCARSARYRSSRVRWRELHSQFNGRAIFVGVPWEHYNFEEEVGRIDYVETPTLLEVAKIIAGADLFIGNQSAPRALAEALKLPVIVEQENPINTHFERECAWYPDGNVGPDLSDKNLISYWCRAASRRALGNSIHTKDELQSLAELCYRVRRVSGDAVEVGVGKGGSAAVIAWCLQRKLFLFDDYSHLDTQEVTDTLVELARFLCIYDYWFELGRFHTEMRTNHVLSFVHIDIGTLHDIKELLLYFIPQMSPGGIIAVSGYPINAFNDILDGAKPTYSPFVSYYTAEY